MLLWRGHRIIGGGRGEQESRGAAVRGVAAGEAAGAWVRTKRGWQGLFATVECLEGVVPPEFLGGLIRWLWRLKTSLVQVWQPALLFVAVIGSFACRDSDERNPV